MIEFRWIKCGANEDGAMRAMRRPNFYGDRQYAKLQFRTMRLFAVPAKGLRQALPGEEVIAVNTDEWAEWVDVGFEDMMPLPKIAKGE